MGARLGPERGQRGRGVLAQRRANLVPEAHHRGVGRRVAFGQRFLAGVAPGLVMAVKAHAPQRRAFSGLALAIVRAEPGQTGTATLRVRSGALQEASVQITLDPAAAHPAPPHPQDPTR